MLASHVTENIGHGAVNLTTSDRVVDAKSDLHYLSVKVGSIVMGFKVTKQQGSVLSL